MSIFGSDDLARTRNVLYTDPDNVPTTTGTGTGERGPMGPQGATGPQGPQGPQGVPGEYIGIFKVISFPNLNLLGAVNTSTLVYTVPSGKNFIVQDVTYAITAVSGSEKTTLPTVQLLRSTSLTTSSYQLSNTMNFNNLTFPDPLVPFFFARTGNTTSATARRIATAGESIYARITVAFDGTGTTTPYTNLRATCIISCYEY
jgi:hypothetical protein